MKKTYILENLDCAHCAAKMEKAVSKIEGVKNASVNFMFLKFTLEADDNVFDVVLERAIAAMKKIEPDCRVIVK